MIVDIYKKRPVINYNQNLQVAMILKCSLWLLYGLPQISTENNLVILAHSINLCVEIFYVHCKDDLEVDPTSLFLFFDKWLYPKSLIIYIYLYTNVWCRSRMSQDCFHGASAFWPFSMQLPWTCYQQFKTHIRNPVVGVVSNLCTILLGFHA